MKKIDYAKSDLEKLSDILICPICGENMCVNANDLVCINNHDINISKNGNTILCRNYRPKEEKVYTKNLFLNRRDFINYGFYNEMHGLIANILNKYDSKYVLDIGCGEGTHDHLIINNAKNENMIIYGVDLARDGISLSSDYYDNNFLSSVADLNFLPIKDNSIDTILNILSSSNETEMERVLKKDVIIIKVTPKKNYLRELREFMNMSEYENETIIDNNIRKNIMLLIKKK